MAKEVKRSTRKVTTEGTATATAPAKTRTATATAPSEEQIRARAYQIYLARHGAPGDPQADWAQAERELRNGR